MQKEKIRTQNLGYPRIGKRRELKRGLEKYWEGAMTGEELQALGTELRRANWLTQRDAGVDFIPSNDFSFYDQVLDMSCLLGNVPSRYAHREGTVPLELYFAMARGRASNGEAGDPGTEVACEMTKWFDTNYHYLVPEFNEETAFSLLGSKVFDEFLEAKALGIDTVPVLIGPLTYLGLGKEIDAETGFDRFSLLSPLLEVYQEILERLEALGAAHVRFDEPILALDLEEPRLRAFEKAYGRLVRAAPGIDLHVATYFGELRDNLDTLVDLPVAGIHIDGVCAASEVDRVVSKLSNSTKVLSIGLVDGRNIWRTDLSLALRRLRGAVDQLGASRVTVSTSCSLLHVPISLEREAALEPEILGWLAFADEKLSELVLLREGIVDCKSTSDEWLANQRALQDRRQSRRVKRPSVQARVGALRDAMYSRRLSFGDRQALQREKLRLPAYPTTTIGSFPQTKVVREARAKFRNGTWTEHQYAVFLRLRTADCVKMQEDLGLDVLVHGEFERNDMVEYFGEQLDGFALTQFGWVQSYGSRCVKPPIIYGDVSRPKPVTVEWSRFAQSLTEKPMKGMLTGPITILQWSFVRNDQALRETANQIALAIRDEVADLEEAGLPIIQIDEAAIREGLPLRQADWREYLNWAVKAFRLASCGVRDHTQIHTHMCYSEFNDMLEAIVAMDADVITIENARSGLELLKALAEFEYPNEIGPGVYDIHSPRVPEVAEMASLIRRAATVLPAGNLWVNPDCGLKTRSWEEVKPALERMVEAASKLREVVGE